MAGTMRNSWKLLTPIFFVLLTMLLAACGGDSVSATTGGTSTVNAGMNKVQLHIEMQVDSSGQVIGVIQGIPVQGSPSNPNTPSTPTTQQV
jgi:hypothetical protein